MWQLPTFELDRFGHTARGNRHWAITTTDDPHPRCGRRARGAGEPNPGRAILK